LPTIAPGLIGLFIASMLAAVMSSCDALMVSASALFTENIYKTFIKPNQSVKHYLMVGRLTSIFVVFCGITIAFGLSSVVSGLEMFWKIQAMMGIAIWVSFFWRRATAIGAWASTICGFLTWSFTSKIELIGWDFNAQFASSLPEVMLFKGQLSLPWQMIIYLTFSLFTMIIISIITKPRDKEDLDRVYECLRTPVLPGEPEVEPLTLPTTTKPAPRTVLINHPDFEINKPSKESVMGFIGAWIAVAILIKLFIWLVS